MFQLCAVEPLTDDVVTEDDARKMRLPFDKGWDHWSIFQKGIPIYSSADYHLVRRTFNALTNLVFLERVAA